MSPIHSELSVSLSVNGDNDSFLRGCGQDWPRAGIQQISIMLSRGCFCQSSLDGCSAMLQGQTLTRCSRGPHPGWGLPCKQLLCPHPKTARVLLPHLTELHMEPQGGRELVQSCVCFRSDISSFLVSLLAMSSSLFPVCFPVLSVEKYR